MLELYRGENATCNICLGYREKVREMNRNYRENINDGSVSAI